jgi:hypothetical protein
VSSHWAPDIEVLEASGVIFFQHLSRRREIVIVVETGAGGQANPPAEGIVGQVLGGARGGGRLDDPVPGVHRVGGALIVGEGVAVGVVRRRGSPGEDGELVMVVEGAGLRAAVAGKARPIADRVQIQLCVWLPRVKDERRFRLS